MVNLRRLLQCPDYKGRCKEKILTEGPFYQVNKYARTEVYYLGITKTKLIFAYLCDNCFYYDEKEQATIQQDPHLELDYILDKKLCHIEGHRDKRRFQFNFVRDEGKRVNYVFQCTDPHIKLWTFWAQKLGVEGDVNLSAVDPIRGKHQAHRHGGTSNDEDTSKQEVRVSRKLRHSFTRNEIEPECALPLTPLQEISHDERYENKLINSFLSQLNDDDLIDMFQNYTRYVRRVSIERKVKKSYSSPQITLQKETDNDSRPLTESASQPIITEKNNENRETIKPQEGFKDRETARPSYYGEELVGIGDIAEMAGHLYYRLENMIQQTQRNVKGLKGNNKISTTESTNISQESTQTSTINNKGNKSADNADEQGEFVDKGEVAGAMDNFYQTLHRRLSGTLRALNILAFKKRLNGPLNDEVGVQYMLYPSKSFSALQRISLLTESTDTLHSGSADYRHSPLASQPQTSKGHRLGLSAAQDRKPLFRQDKIVRIKNKTEIINIPDLMAMINNQPPITRGKIVNSQIPPTLPKQNPPINPGIDSTKSGIKIDNESNSHKNHFKSHHTDMSASYSLLCNKSTSSNLDPHDPCMDKGHCRGQQDISEDRRRFIRRWQEGFINTEFLPVPDGSYQDMPVVMFIGGQITSEKSFRCVLLHTTHPSHIDLKSEDKGNRRETNSSGVSMDEKWNDEKYSTTHTKDASTHMSYTHTRKTIECAITETQHILHEDIVSKASME